MRIGPFGLALLLGGCGALSANSTQSAQEAVANGLFYGVMAAASSQGSDHDHAHAHTPHHYAARHADHPHRYRCTTEDGEDLPFLARSRAAAQSACGADCVCSDPRMVEELRLYERQYFYERE